MRANGKPKIFLLDDDQDVQHHQMVQRGKEEQKKMKLQIIDDCILPRMEKLKIIDDDQDKFCSSSKKKQKPTIYVLPQNEQQEERKSKYNSNSNRKQDKSQSSSSSPSSDYSPQGSLDNKIQKVVVLTDEQKDTVLQFREYSKFFNEKDDQDEILNLFLNKFDGQDQSQSDSLEVAQVEFQGSQFAFKPSTLKRLLQVFPSDWSRIKAILVEADSSYDLLILSKKAQVEFPNEELHKSSKGFWTEQLISLYLYEGWRPSKRPKIDEINQAKKRLELNRELIQDYLRNMDECENPEMMKALEVQIDQLVGQIGKDEEIASTDIFAMVNDDPERLTYEIDMHYLHIEEAKKKLEEYLLQIHFDLESGTIKNNTDQKGIHIVKVICGYSKNHAIFNMRSAFKEMLQGSQFDFAYAPEHGAFLIKIAY